MHGQTPAIHSTERRQNKEVCRTEQSHSQASGDRGCAILSAQRDRVGLLHSRKPEVSGLRATLQDTEDRESFIFKSPYFNIWFVKIYTKILKKLKAFYIIGIIKLCWFLCSKWWQIPRWKILFLVRIASHGCTSVGKGIVIKVARQESFKLAGHLHFTRSKFQSFYPV